MPISGIRILPQGHGPHKSLPSSAAGLKKAAAQYASTKHTPELDLIRLAVETEDGAEGFADITTNKGRLVLMLHPLAAAPRNKRQRKPQKRGKRRPSR